ncbi:hypothetical protein N7U66_02875 [Lacinutrix neustonica]|uniref:Uncharacterized protein n=1 Tax=Lacinutrix neustonica TaxID=2980107 RepID=A0A9E8SET2_9FLAO|nr:hypothetical protein [Lacinutrix neustonica]WAC02644.1 hypothetical protein N7U66_02875 [Lacinutrix neustonica]
MEEFLKENYKILTLSIEFLAAFSSLYFYHKYKNTAAKFFIYFIFYLFICDFISLNYYYFVNNYLVFFKGTILEKNKWWSTLYWKIGAIIFYSFYYNKILKKSIFKILLKTLTYCFLIISFVKIFKNWDDFFVISFPIISILGAIIILMCSIFYFIEGLEYNKILVFYKSINFYISVSIFIWWLIITPLVFYDLYFSTSDWNFVILKWQIYLFANIFMYTTFTIGLIVSKPENSSNE